MTHDQLIRFSPYFFALVILTPIVIVALLGTPGAGPCH